MNTKQLLFGLFLAAIALMSCKKDTPPVDEPEVNPDSPRVSTLYFPLQQGNYWVYRHSSSDTTGTIWTPMGIIDTLLVIDADTLIGSEHFAALIDKRYHDGTLSAQDYSFLRDSSGFLVDDKGRVLLSVDTGNTVIYHDVYDTGSDTLYYGDYRMRNVPNPVITDAGSFSCIDFQGEIYVISDGFSHAWYTHDYYAENVGLVCSLNFFLSDPRMGYRRELISFHMQ